MASSQQRPWSSQQPRELVDLIKVQAYGINMERPQAFVDQLHLEFRHGL